MKKLWFIVLLCVGTTSANAATRFVALDIIMEADQPIAAWQFELREGSSLMTVVGIENGDSAAFGAAPYYDRDAVSTGRADRIVVADFSLSDDDQLPSGRFRVVTVHVMLAGESPDFELKLITATTRDGKPIDASITVREHTGSQP